MTPSVSSLFVLILSLQVFLLSGCQPESERILVPTDVIVDVTTLGADPSGIEESTEAIQGGIDSGTSLYFPPGTYRIEDTLHFRADNVQYRFVDASLMTTSRIVLFDVSAHDAVIDGLVVDGRGGTVPSFAGEILSKAERVTLHNCEFRDFSGDESTSHQYGLRIDLENVRDFVVSECRFENISQPNDGDPDRYDFSGGIYFLSSSAQVDHASYGIVEASVFRNIYNTPNPPNDTRIDADAIRFYYPGDSTYGSQHTNIRIERNRFIDCQKRAIKVSGIGGILIRDNEVSNRRSDHYGHEAVEIHGGATGVTIDGLRVDGNINRGVQVIAASDIVIRNVEFERVSRSEQGVEYAYAVIVRPVEGTTWDFEHFVVEGIHTNGAKGVYFENVNGIKIQDVYVEDFATNPFDSDYEPPYEETYFDDLISLKECRDVDLSGFWNVVPQSNVATVLKIHNCTDVRVSGCDLVGWGNPVVQVVEDDTGECSGISLSDVSVRQEGYLAPSGEEAHTLLFRSSRQGSEDGISNVEFSNVRVLLPDQPYPLDCYGALLECPDSRIDEFRVLHWGDNSPQMRAMLALSHSDRSVVGGLQFWARDNMRALYVLATAGLEISDVAVCAPGSYITVDPGCSDVSIDLIRSGWDFNHEIPNLDGDPVFEEIECSDWDPQWRTSSRHE